MSSGGRRDLQREAKIDDRQTVDGVGVGGTSSGRAKSVPGRLCRRSAKANTVSAALPTKVVSVDQLQHLCTQISILLRLQPSVKHTMGVRSRISNVIFFIIAITATALHTGLMGHIVIYPKEQNVTVGSTVHLDCITNASKPIDWQYSKLDGTTEKVLFWGQRYDGEEKQLHYKLDKKTSVTVNFTSGQSELAIFNVTKYDSGIYICSDSEEPEHSASARVIVLIDEGSTVSQCPRGAEVVPTFVGEETQLKLATTKPQSIQVEYRAIGSYQQDRVFYEGSFVNNYVQSRRFGFNVTGYKWVLIIGDVQRSDAGSYIFSEDNGLGRSVYIELMVSGVKCNDVCTWYNSQDGVNCTIEHAGNCAPQLVWKQAETSASGNHKLYNTTTIATEYDFTEVLLLRTNNPSTEICMMVGSSEKIQSSSRIKLRNLSCEYTTFDSDDEKSCCESHVIAIVVVVVTVVGITLFAIGLFFFRKRSRCRTPIRRKKLEHYTTRSSTSV